MSTEYRDPLLCIIREWWQEQLLDSSSFALIEAEDVQKLVLEQFDALMQSSSAKDDARKVPNHLYRSLSQKSGSHDSEGLKRATALACELLGVCMSVCDRLKMRDAQGKLIAAASQYADTRMGSMSLISASKPWLVALKAYLQSRTEGLDQGLKSTLPFDPDGYDFVSGHDENEKKLKLEEILTNIRREFDAMQKKPQDRNKLLAKKLYEHGITTIPKSEQYASYLRQVVGLFSSRTDDGYKKFHSYMRDLIFK